MRWQSVLIQGDDATVRDLAVDAVRLISMLKSPIDVSLISRRPTRLNGEWVELQLVLFLNRQPEGESPFDEAVAAFGHPVDLSGHGAEVRGRLAANPHVALAVAASRRIGRAIFVHCSDGTCSSGFLQFADGRLVLRLRIRPLVRGSVEEAWDRCAAVWREAGVVGNGADDHWVFDHELAAALGRRHRRRRPFFLERIADADPLLAAYAFKCLLRTGEVRGDDLPVGSLQRTEPVDVQWADMILPEPLGEYFAGGLAEKIRP
jgi:hypothetical protein